MTRKIAVDGLGDQFWGTIGNTTGHILAFKYLTYVYSYITLSKHTHLRMYMLL